MRKREIWQWQKGQRQARWEGRNFLLQTLKLKKGGCELRNTASEKGQETVSIWKRPGNHLQNGMQPCWYLGPLKPVLGSDPLSCKIMHLHCFTYKTVVICNSSNSKGIHRVTYLILMRMDFLLAFTFLIHLWNKWIQLCKRNLCINFIALFEDYWENICKPLEQCTLEVVRGQRLVIIIMIVIV